ncbi:selenocysteine lyase/cysteine desulfurase [Staphylococcus hominis]
MAKVAHENGSLLLVVDAYQSIGQMHIDVKEMDVDMLVAGTRKYMLGISGIAFMYIKKELLDQLTSNSTGQAG